MFMVNYLASKDEKNELLLQFQALDLNNDGKLSTEELLIGYSKIMDENIAAEEVKRIMDEVDKDGNGSIDYTGISFIKRICHGHNQQGKPFPSEQVGNYFQNV